MFKHSIQDVVSFVLKRNLDTVTSDGESLHLIGLSSALLSCKAVNTSSIVNKWSCSLSVYKYSLVYLINISSKLVQLLDFSPH